VKELIVNVLKGSFKILVKAKPKLLLSSNKRKHEISSDDDDNNDEEERRVQKK
jgi:hypothetical protein